MWVSGEQTSGRSFSPWLVGHVPVVVTLPWVTDCSCTVLGMRSSWLGCEALRLTLDLKRVFTIVDFPSPLCPVGTPTAPVYPPHPPMIN